MKENMKRIKGLRDLLKTLKFEKQAHDPSLFEELPLVDLPPKPQTIEEAEEELKALKTLIMDKDTSVIETLCKFRKVSFRSNILEHYKNNYSISSKFRINNKNQISYNCGAFYNIDESKEVIMSKIFEPSPMDRIITTESRMQQYLMKTSINTISCNMLNPKQIAVYTPNA